jgi:hypothetical protein
MTFAIHTHGVSTPGQKVGRYKSPITGLTSSYYAEDGLITVITEEKDGKESYNRVSRAELVARIITVNQMAKRSKYPHERDAMIRFAADLMEVSKAAKAQGDPFASPEVARQVAEDRRKIIVSPGSPGFRGGADYKFTTGMPAMPQAPASAPVRDLGGTKVLDASRIFS